MPIYEYRCAACGHDVEALQKITDAPLTECPACHKPQLQKRVSAAGFQLKGSGWYVTDFRNKGGAKPAKDKPAEGEGAKANAAETTSDASSTDSTKTAEKSADKAASSASDAKPATTSSSTAKSDA